MLHKLLDFPALTGEHEPAVEILRPRVGGGLLKTAGALSPEIEKIAAGLKPTDKVAYLVNRALGAFEVWGPNNNGDAFRQVEDLGVGVKEAEDWGYRTFAKHAHNFEHHRNKNPERALGKVVHAVWNPRMRRVELIKEVDREKAAFWLTKMEQGDPVETSMGCATDPETPIWTPSGSRRIADIRAGDQVWSGEGRVCFVDYAMVRHYEGKAFQVSARGIPDLEMTEEHPWRVVKRDAVRSNPPRGCARRVDIREEESGYVRSDELEVGDYLVQPIPQEEVETDLPVEFFRLAGYYLAEGYGNLSNGDRQVYPWLIVNKDDEAAWEVPHLVSILDPDATVTVEPHHESDEALNIQIFSDRLGRLLMACCGRTSDDKHLSPAVMLAPRTLQAAFLGAYLNGDGFVSSGKLHASTKSRSLAFQIEILAARVGMLGNIQRIEHGPSSVVNQPTTEFQTRFGLRGSEVMRGHCAKVASPKTKACNSPKILTPWAILTPITKIKSREHVGLVYNFAVDGDDSYVSGEVATHNCKVAFDVCSICDNQAVTRAEYCKHAKEEMLRIYPSGKVACVFNPRPRFFDDSFVFRGADRSNGVYAKIAHEKGAFVDQREYAADSASSPANLSVDRFEQEYGGITSDPSEQPVTRQGSDNVNLIPGEKLTGVAPGQKGSGTGQTPSHHPRSKIAEDLTAAEIETLEQCDDLFDRDLLSKLAQYPIEEVFGSASSMGIVLAPEEYQYLALCKEGMHREAGAFLEANVRFPVPGPEGGNVPEEFFDAHRKTAEEFHGWPDSAQVVDLLKPWIVKRSCLVPVAHARLAYYLSGGEKVAAMREKKAVVLSDLLAGLGAGYLGYRALGGESMKIPSSTMGRVGTVAALVALSKALQTGGDALEAKKKAVTPSGRIIKISAAVASDHAAYREAEYAMQKTAAGSFAKGVALPFSAGFLGSSYLRARAMEGRRLGDIEELIAKHPVLSGVGATLLATKLKGLRFKKADMIKA